MIQVSLKPCPEVIKLFSYSTQLRTQFILLINVKMPKIVTFINMINKKKYEKLLYFTPLVVEGAI